ncbi:hypothetical protein IMZ31_22055 (plasmid) [Pontibacillus sp. ALD_SL1]|uniref:hypothetical protein n=1 Tax=Pontibacillus sp. ALD_SL1 TaxID=2777185 RepID=UPI001A976C02|nr:hypothetical protein [Pontibacillus sp. ALD_SL1]QST02138.1 hypothetical protein IMZ31_22055 [Pontibacillus sp. ALD_SL1]
MLYTLEGKRILDVPYKKDYDQWRPRLNDKDYDQIVEALNDHIEGDEIHTSSFIPGHDWRGTVYEPIWHACNHNDTRAALFYGLILYKVMIEHPESWICGKFEMNGKKLKGTTYFKAKNLP